MIVCSCSGLSDKRIIKIIKEDSYGAEEVLKRCQNGCGSCKNKVIGIITDEKSTVEPQKN